MDECIIHNPKTVIYKNLFGKTERGEQPTRKKKSKNKMEWWEMIPNIKTKIRKECFKKKTYSMQKYIGEKNSQTLAKKFSSRAGF